MAYNLDMEYDDMKLGMEYNYVAICYNGSKVFLYYIYKNDDERVVTFSKSVDCFEREEKEVFYKLELSIDTTIYLVDTNKLVAELIAINPDPFELFDDCDGNGHVKSRAVEHIYHPNFKVLYHADNFNRNGVISVLKKHYFNLTDPSEQRIIDMVEGNKVYLRSWLWRKCRDILSLCYPEAFCDPECHRHYEIQM